MCDQSTDAIHVAHSDASMTVDFNPAKTKDQQTSSNDLLQLRHACVGCDIIQCNASTNTKQCVYHTKQTSSDDLILKRNVGIGMEQKINAHDVAVSTDSLVFRNVAVNCSLEMESRTQMFDKMTMTLICGCDYFINSKSNSAPNGVETNTTNPSVNTFMKAQEVLKRQIPLNESRNLFNETINKTSRNVSTFHIDLKKSNYVRRTAQISSPNSSTSSSLQTSQS